MAKTETKAAEKKKTADAPQEEPSNAGKEVALKLHSERLPYHPLIQERFGIDRAGWRVMVESIWPNAKTVEAVIMALSYCRARQLDPFKRPVHIVPVYNSALRATVETVWPGISELRTTAMRTNSYAGCDPCVFGDDIEETFFGQDRDKNEEKVTVIFPEWAQITVYRMLQGNRVPFPGPRVYWKETYATKSFFSEVPNSMWEGRPRGQLEKCAEAAALRRAYPEELGNEYAAEEMSGRVVDHGGAPVIPAPARPKREDYLGKPAIEGTKTGEARKPEPEPHEPDGGEIIEGDTQPADQSEPPTAAEVNDWLDAKIVEAKAVTDIAVLEEMDPQVWKYLKDKGCDKDLGPEWDRDGYLANKRRLQAK